MVVILTIAVDSGPAWLAVASIRVDAISAVAVEARVWLAVVDVG